MSNIDHNGLNADERAAIRELMTDLKGLSAEPALDCIGLNSLLRHFGTLVAREVELGLAVQSRDQNLYPVMLEAVASWAGALSLEYFEPVESPAAEALEGVKQAAAHARQVIEGMPSSPGAGSEPDFHKIAFHLDHLEALTEEGWWAEWGGCMWVENILRSFGPLVAVAARAAEEDDDWTAGSQVVLSHVQGYLSWERLCPSGDDPVALELVQDAERALEALRSHLAGSS